MGGMGARPRVVRLYEGLVLHGSRSFWLAGCLFWKEPKLIKFAAAGVLFCHPYHVDVGTGESVSVQHDVAKGNSNRDWSSSTHASTSGCLSNLI